MGYVSLQEGSYMCQDSKQKPITHFSRIPFSLLDSGFLKGAWDVTDPVVIFFQDELWGFF